MSSPFARLFIVATALLLPALAQAVAFTNSNYTGITVGAPFTLTWAGDSTVRPFYPGKPH